MPPPGRDRAYPPLFPLRAEALVQASRKTRYVRVGRLSNGLLDVERKAGKYYELAKRNTQTSPFLLLPPEVRNRIYTYTLGHETFVLARGAIKARDTRKTTQYFALLSVCRQIYAETAVLPFKLNAFYAHSPASLTTLLDRLFPAARANVTSVILGGFLDWHAHVGKGYALPEWWEGCDLSGLPALREVQVLTRLARCYCIKGGVAANRLLVEVEEGEKGLEGRIREGCPGVRRVVFRRNIRFVCLD